MTLLTPQRVPCLSETSNRGKSVGSSIKQIYGRRLYMINALTGLWGMLVYSSRYENYLGAKN